MTMSPADTVRAPQFFETPGQIAERARQDSLAAYTRALYYAKRHGLPPPPPPPPRTPPADADTSQARRPPVQPAPPDTTRGPVIGPSR